MTDRMPYRLQALIKTARKFPFFETMLRSRYEREFAGARNANLFRGIFPSVAAAEASAPAQSKLGYDHPEPAAMYRGRLEQIYPADYPVIYWLQNILKPGQSVFDLGGHIGVAYYAYTRYLDYPPDLQWTVCDVPAVVESGRALATEEGRTNLHFTVDRAEASGASIFHAAGVLQYLSDPLPKILAPLAKKPQHIILNLCAFTEGSPFVTLQNIGTSFCPYIIHSRQDITTGLQDLGYELVDNWENPEKSCTIPLDADYSLSHYVGAYFRLVR